MTTPDDRTHAEPGLPGRMAEPLSFALPPGTQLDEFEILRTLGEGGFGIVYLAQDHALDRRVALKEYMPATLATRTHARTVQPRSERQQDIFAVGLRSFINEARLLASFDHPSLLKVHRFWEGNGTAYMAMPYYEGQTLAAVLKRMDSAPSQAWLSALLDPLLDALGTMHAAHCYHRDIAPDNILILADGRPLLLDFGAARRVIGDLTQSLTVILKTGYAPVEQYGGVAHMAQGPWTDLYALASVVHLAITGSTPPQAVARFVQDSYEPLVRVAAGRYDAGFLHAIDQALSVLPADRPQSVVALRDALYGRASQPWRLPDDPFAAFEVERTVIRPSAGRTPSPPSSIPGNFDPLSAPDAEPPATPRSPSATDEPRLSPAPRPRPNIAASRRPGDAEPSKPDAGRIQAIILAPRRLATAALRALWNALNRRPADAVQATSQRWINEPLLFSVTAPRSATPGSEFTVSFAAYIPSAKAEANKLERSLVGQNARQIVDVAPDGAATWCKGTPFTVRLSGRSFDFEQPEQTFHWSGTKNVLGFAVQLQPSACASAVLTATVQVRGIVVASIPIQIDVFNPGRFQLGAEETSQTVKPAPSSAFASYASKDTENVAGRLSSLKRYAPGLRIFQDCLDLRPGEAYKPQLQAEIEAREVFWLFWSRNAAASTWVAWELDTALSRKPIEAIVPMPLEDPALAPPPKQLEHEHFRDRFMIASQALLRIQELTAKREG